MNGAYSLSNRSGLTRQGVALWVLCGLAAPAWAAAVDLPPSVDPRSVDHMKPGLAANSLAQSLEFNIPAQPLAAALNQYGAISDQPAVFVSDMVAGRTSSTVEGKHSSEEGLRLLLRGTGLSFEKITSHLGSTFLLKEVGRPVARATLAAFYASTGYPGLIQTRIQEMLCADPLIMPGQIDSVFRFQLDSSGRIHNVLLLDSTGNPQRDHALLSDLQRVNIGLAPPPAMVEQPLTMHLRPSDSHAALPCAPQREPSQ